MDKDTPSSDRRRKAEQMLKDAGYKTGGVVKDEKRRGRRKMGADGEGRTLARGGMAKEKC